MENPEVDIITACQSGHTERFSELYELYAKKIYRFIYYKTLHRETSEDLTSEVFFKALKSIRSFDARQKFSTWIYKIALNTVIDHFRTSKKTYNVDDVWDLESGEDVVQNVDNKSMHEKIKKLLDGFSPTERDIITMRVWQDLPYEEIAAIVGKTEGNCKTIFSRSMLRLRKGAVSFGALVALIFMYK